MRYCAPSGGSSHERECKLISTPTTDIRVENVGISVGIGEYCTCDGDLCNSAPTSIGHLTVSFIGVASVLSLTTARLLSQ